LEFDTNKEYMVDIILSLKNVNMQNNLVRYRVKYWIHKSDFMKKKLCLRIKSVLKVVYISFRIKSFVN